MSSNTVELSGNTVELSGNTVELLKQAAQCLRKAQVIEDKNVVQKIMKRELRAQQDWDWGEITTTLPIPALLTLSNRFLSTSTI
jgi:hypothetical protein